MLVKDIKPIDQINFTIDILDKKKYGRICGVSHNFLDKTISELIRAKSRGIRIVINTPISVNHNDSKEDFSKLFSFCSKYKIDEWKLIEEMDDEKNIFPKFYLEDYARKMGIKIKGTIKGCKIKLRHLGVPITLYRCHCKAVELNRKYILESLFLDPAGNILLCMKREDKIDLLNNIKIRDDNSIIEKIKSINFKKICPILK